jgi:hypothetical protein
MPGVGPPKSSAAPGRVAGLPCLSPNGLAGKHAPGPSPVRPLIRPRPLPVPRLPAHRRRRLPAASPSSRHHHHHHATMITRRLDRLNVGGCAAKGRASAARWPARGGCGVPRQRDTWRADALPTVAGMQPSPSLAQLTTVWAGRKRPVHPDVVRHAGREQVRVPLRRVRRRTAPAETSRRCAVSRRWGYK